MLHLALLLGQLLAILLAARIAGRLVRPLGQPAVIGEMFAGIALGPSLLGAIAPETLRRLFPADAMMPLATLSQLGVLLFMFVVGLRIDLPALGARAKAAVAVSHSSIALPFLLGAALAPWLHPTLAGRGQSGAGVGLLPFALFLGAAMSVTAFPVLARILAERGLLKTPMGAVAIASAAVDDVTAWCILAGVVAVARAQDAVSAFVITIAGAAAFAAILIFVGRRVLTWYVGRRVPADGSISVDVVGAAVLLALASALCTELIGVHALFGAFIAGTIVPREAQLAEGIADRIESVVSPVLLPVFFAYTGLRTEIGLLRDPALWVVFAAVFAAAVVGKFGGSTIAARLANLSWRDALGVGILMNTRGLMELIVLNVGLDLGVISPPLFAVLVCMALITTFMTSPLLSLIRRPAATPVLSPPPRAQV
jgi:Kef-type K+ transport system membrane component KefB